MRYELTNVMVKSYQTSGSADAADSFDFTAEGEAQEVGLLLPAVQAAKEAARRQTEEASDDSFDFKMADSGGASEGGPGEWIPILDISEGTHKPSSGDAAVLDFALTGNPIEDDGNSHHDNWLEHG
ncbi:MAG: hypothetical protein AAFU55_08680 [Pseudomonadota bacterium]